MADVRIMKAVEYNKLPAKFKKDNRFSDLWSKGYWLQRKYDGCFAKITVTPYSCSAETRTGEPIRSVGHILAQLQQLVRAYGLTEGVVLLGELWSREHDFPTISGMVRRHSPAPELCFVLNDYLPLGMDTERGYCDRYYDIVRFLSEDAGPHCEVAETYTAFEWDNDAEGYARRWKQEGGFDGAILRNPVAGYTVGIVKAGEIIKVKPLLSLDLPVKAWFSEPGEKTGRPVYSIEVEYRGVTSRVGSGMPHDFDSVPRVGQIVEIECMDITEDGKLREPRYKGIRFDKEQPDT